MEYFAVYAPSAENTDTEELVFESKVDALKIFKTHKDARFKSFKSRGEALKFAKNGTNPVASILDSILKSPPLSQPPMKSLEKSNFPGIKPQQYVAFRKEIEQNNVQKVYEMICTNPRYLVGSGDTPSILKEGPRYNALHVAAMNKHEKMAKLILQTVEQPQFVELLHGIKGGSMDPNVEVMSSNLLKSYLNTPDKSRNETPLHFAAKIGALEVIEVLISYPLCEMMPNFEGMYPKDIICARTPDTPVDVKKAIAKLLEERFFVPVLRSSDSSVQPSIGEPFTPSNMPKPSSDPMSPSMEIKAYAGPMTLEQATTFRKRWKTPPRLIPTSNLNNSCSPNSSFSLSSPVNSSRLAKSISEIVSSTPKHKKKLFDGKGDEDEDLYLENISGDTNGNHTVISNGVLGEHEKEEYQELFEDLVESKNQMEVEKENMFNGYRDPTPMMDTPVRMKHDSNSNHLNHNYNSGELFSNARSSGSSGSQMTYLDESGSVYSSDNVFDSPSFKEKNIRLTDINKGLEKIGRDLAIEKNVGWKEHWDFLGRLIEIRSDDGLACFESFLKQKEKLGLVAEPARNVSSAKKDLNDSLGAICAGFYSLDLNEMADKSSRSTKNGLTSPSSSISRFSFPSDFSPSTNVNSTLSIPYVCIEKNCRAFANRLANLLEGETIQDQHSYEKMLSQEINRLNTSIDNYKRDSRFNVINFQKVHARYSFLLVWYLKKNNVEVKYLRNSKPLISKVYALASQYSTPNCFDTNKDVPKLHAVCLSGFIKNYIEKQDKIFNPENVETETACVDAWNGPDIVECSCLLESNVNNSKHRRDIRKRLYSENSSRGSQQMVDLWAPRSSQAYDDEDLFLSCSDSDSESDEYLTPPQSPTKFDSDDDDMNAFEESLDSFEQEKDFILFIKGDQPTQTDSDVFDAIGITFTVDAVKYPLVSKWFNAMKLLHVKNQQNCLKNKIRLFTPKLKMRSGLFHS